MIPPCSLSCPGVLHHGRITERSWASLIGLPLVSANLHLLNYSHCSCRFYRTFQLGWRSQDKTNVSAMWISFTQLLLLPSGHQIFISISSRPGTGKRWSWHMHGLRCTLPATHSRIKVRTSNNKKAHMELYSPP